MKHHGVEIRTRELNRNTLNDELNARWEDGWELHTAFEQDSGTVLIFERRDP